LKQIALYTVSDRALVAPHAGAWIETMDEWQQKADDVSSLLTQERGLKLRLSQIPSAISMSLLTQERGLKLLLYRQSESFVDLYKTLVGNG
jgi:hypothetical protein